MSSQLLLTLGGVKSVLLPCRQAAVFAVLSMLDTYHAMLLKVLMLLWKWIVQQKAVVKGIAPPAREESCCRPLIMLWLGQ